MKVTNNLWMIVTSMVFFVLVSLAVNAAECAYTDLTLSQNPVNFTVGDPTSKIKLTISPPGSPIEGVWNGYANATLQLPLGLDNMSDTFQNLVGYGLPTKTWSVNATLEGAFTVNTSIVNKTGFECTKSISFNSVRPRDVNLSIQIEDLTTLTVNQPVTVNVTMSNTGADPAFNIDQDVESSVFNDITVNIPAVNSSGSDVQVHSITPTSCGTGKIIDVYARNYDDGQGNLLPTVSDSDSFDVEGSDLTVLSVVPSDLNPTAGNTITISAEVKNLAGQSASNAKVEFYYDIVSAGNKISAVSLSNTNLAVNDVETVNATWAVVGSGNHTLFAVVSGDNECPTANNQEQSAVLNADAAPATPAPSGGSGGSSSFKFECNDKRDNDKDGLIDYPDDPGCNGRYDNNEFNCVPNWVCDAKWGACEPKGRQARSCVDLNKCGTEEGKPDTLKDCTYVEPKVEDKVKPKPEDKEGLKKVKLGPSTRKAATLIVNERILIELSLKKESHVVELNEIKADSVMITVYSEPMKLEIKLGETKNIDADNDGKDDFSITVNSITNGQASLSFAEFSQEEEKASSMPETVSKITGAVIGKVGFVKSHPAWTLGVMVITILLLILSFVYKKRSDAGEKPKEGNKAKKNKASNKTKASKTVKRK